MDKISAPWWLRIKFRVLVFGIFMSVLPLLLIGISIFNTTNLKLKENIQQKNLERATAIAEQVETSIHNIADNLNLVSTTNAEVILGDPIAREKVLNILLQQEPFLEDLMVANQNFDVLGHVSRREVILPGSDQNKLSSVMIDKDKPYSISKVFFSKERRPEFYITVGIYNPQTREHMGFIQARTDLKGVLTKHVTTRVGNAGTIYFVDEDGYLIGHTDFSRVLKQEDLKDNPMVSSFLKGGKSSFEFKNSEGRNVIGLFAPVKTPNWAVFIEQPVIEAYEPIYAFTRKLLGTLLFTISVVTMMSIFFGLKLVRPIEELEGQVRTITATGDLQSHIPQNSKDEIGRLAQAFKQLMDMQDEMTQNIKAEKELLRTVVDSIGAGMILLNSEKKIIWWNPIFAEWFGDRNYKNVAYDEVLNGEDDLDHLPPEIGKVKSFALKNEVKHLRQIYYLINPENHENTHYLILFEDVTQQIEMEALVAQTDKMAAIGILASGIAHEINNPLAIVSAYTEDLLDNLKDNPEKLNIEELQDGLNITTQQITRCKRITNGLLHFARRREQEWSLLDLEPATSKTLELLEYKAKQRNIKFSKNLQTGLFILGNENEWQQVVFNLACNALDASKDNSIIEIQAWGKEEEVYFTIRDYGIGIAQSNLNKVFNPFYTTKPPGQGTGLGLFVSYGIIQKMNGKLSLESTEGKGTTVNVHLPSYKVG